MFLGDSIGRAVEELWQLAMTMASLKHIAGMVTQELQTTTASTGLGEENIETDDSHRTSPVDKTEAVSNKCFANNDVIDTEDTEQDAFFCNSVHKQETPSHPEESMSTENENEKVFEQISMVAHKLPQHDAPQQISEFPVSMAAHAIVTNDEDERMDNHENISIISHQITDQYTSVEPAMIDEDPQIVSLLTGRLSPWISMFTHEMSYLESPAESSEHLVSMVAHHQHIFENNSISHAEDALSMVCHQTSEHYIVEACQAGKLEQEQVKELVEEERTDQVENSIFISSMVNHQLSENEFLLDVSETPISMATHVIATDNMEDTAEASQTVSMIGHQMLNENESIEQEVPCSIIEDNDSPDHEQMLEEGTCFIPSVCTPGVFNDDARVETTHHEFKLDEEEQQDQTIAVVNPEMCENEAIDEPTFFSSMVAHQLAPCGNVLESSEVPLAMAAHVIRTDLENTADTSQHMSMIGHQITNIVIDMEQTMYLSISKKMEESNISNTFYPSMSTHEMPYHDTPVQPMECQVSMVTHYQHMPEDNEVDVLSMICHQARMHDNIKQEEIRKTEIISATKFSKYEEAVFTPELTFSISMVAHKLPQFDTLFESPEIPATMTAHLVNTHGMDKDGEHENMTMVVHQIINEDQSILPDNNVVNDRPEDKLKENYVAYEEVCEENNKMLAEENFLHTESVLTTALSTEQYSSSGVSNDHQEFSTLISVCISEESAAASGQRKDNPATVVCNKEENIIEHEEEMYSKSLKRNYLDTVEVQKPSFLSSMVSHQLSYMETPNEFQDFLVSSTTHGYSLISSEDHGLVSSILSHQIQKLNPKDTTIEKAKEEESEHLSSLVTHQLPIEDDNCLATTGTHGPLSEESDSPLQSCLDISVLDHMEKIINEEDLKDKPERNPSNNSDSHEIAFVTSLASHQLRSLPPCDQLESHDCFTSMAAHQDMATSEGRDFVSMATHMESNDVSKVIKHKALAVQDEEKISKPNDIIESLELVENKTQSYTKGSHMVEHKEDLPQKETECQGKIPVGTEEEEETPKTFDNFEHTADNNEVVKSYNSKLDRISELQRIVEDEIEEFENQKKKNSKIIENNVETTETQIVSNVKNVEFKSCIIVHQQVNEGFESEQFTEEYEKIRNEENWRDDESFSSSSESVNSVIFTTSENLISNDKPMELNEDETHSETNSDHEEVEENVIKASCTLENNSPVVITTNPYPAKSLEFVSQEEGVKHTTEQHGVIRDNQQAENYDDNFEEEFDELKMQMKKIPRRSSNATTKIRETELLNSFFKEELKQADEKFMKKPKEKATKNAMTLTTFNDNVKKQTYKIRFKVSLNKDSSKSSVLHYLLGCFGGEKMFQQK